MADAMDLAAGAPTLRAEEFDYALPPGRIAQEPAEKRDEARLLVLPARGFAPRHLRVRDLPEVLRAGDLLVLNDARVRPWKVAGRTARGRPVEVYLIRRLVDPDVSATARVETALPGPAAPGAFEAYLKTRKPDPAGERLDLEGGRLRATARRLGEGPRWEVRFDEGARTEAILEEAGRAPLPPYIERPAGEDPRRAADRERYQTVYAARRGSSPAGRSM